MKIAIGCDPNADGYKQILKDYIISLGHECTDLGSDDPIYGKVAVTLAEKVVCGEFDRGVLLCGTGIGVCIAANKVKGAYAANVTSVYQAQRASLSNNANIITIGSQVTGIEVAKTMVREYLSNAFDPSSRSAQKIDYICQYETVSGSRS